MARLELNLAAALIPDAVSMLLLRQHYSTAPSQMSLSLITYMIVFTNEAVRKTKIDPDVHVLGARLYRGA
jgi:hypothetical protein